LALIASQKRRDALDVAGREAHRGDGARGANDEEWCTNRGFFRACTAVIQAAAVDDTAINLFI
jgi:hypothetical protein